MSLINKLDLYSQIKDLKQKLKPLNYLKTDNELLATFNRNDNDSIEFAVITHYKSNIFALDSVKNKVVETIKDKKITLKTGKIIMENVYIIGTGMLRFNKYPDRDVRDMAHEVTRAALEDAGILQDALDAVFFSNSFWGMFSNQHSIRGQVVMRSMGIDRIPITNVENEHYTDEFNDESTCNFF